MNTQIDIITIITQTLLLWINHKHISHGWSVLYIASLAETTNELEASDILRVEVAVIVKSVTITCHLLAQII